MKLNVGCGRSAIAGWVNIDVVPLPGVDVVIDLESCDRVPLPFADDSVDEILLSHVVEHLRSPLPLVQELWRVASPEALMTVRVPYGSSDDAFEDPTHVRQYFVGSFGYFGQPYYWRADYGYRGDWRTDAVTLAISRAVHGDAEQSEIWDRIVTLRNQVVEMTATLRCVKPVRAPERWLIAAPPVFLQWVD